VNGSDAAGSRDTRGCTAASDRLLAETVRAEAARIVATLTASFGSLDLAEEAVAEAIEEAVRAWRRTGIPRHPGAWITQAARRNALDRVRREARYREKLGLLARSLPDVVDEPTGGAGDRDDRLPLLFGCCHPAIAPEARVALTLRAVCGLTTAQIARASLVPETTVAQRIVRAKRRIAATGIPLRVPEGRDRVERLDLVLTVVSVMYSEAHLAAGGGAEADRDLADDALWLARIIAEALPSEAEAHGLLALLLLHRARETARSDGGELVLLDRQDRSRWDRAMLDEGHRELERAARLRRPGRWQLHAAIAACHTDTAAAEETDWLQVLTLYDLLLAHDRSPIVRLNRAVALAQVEGPCVGLAEADTLGDELGRYHLWHAVRARLLRELGRDDDAVGADRRAWELTSNDAERRLIEARLGAPRFRS